MTTTGFIDTQDVFVDTLRRGEECLPSLNKLYVSLCSDNEERNLHIYFCVGERDTISQ